MYVYKYYRISEHSFENLKENKICFNYMGNFADSNEGKFWVASETTRTISDLVEEKLSRCLADRVSLLFTEKVLFKIRVFSATNSPYYHYMWDEYADNGKGFCVAYEKRDLQRCSTDNSVMCYYDAIKEPDCFFEKVISKEECNKIIGQILFTKHLRPGIENNRKVCYEKEHEIRYIKVILKQDIREVNLKEYLKKDDKFAYYYDVITKRHYITPKLYFEKVNACNIFAGPNIDDINFKKLEFLASEMSVPLIRISENDLKDE